MHALYMHVISITPTSHAPTHTCRSIVSFHLLVRLPPGAPRLAECSNGNTACWGMLQEYMEVGVYHHRIHMGEEGEERGWSPSTR